MSNPHELQKAECEHAGLPFPGCQAPANNYCIHCGETFCDEHGKIHVEDNE